MLNFRTVKGAEEKYAVSKDGTFLFLAQFGKLSYEIHSSNNTHSSDQLLENLRALHEAYNITLPAKFHYRLRTDVDALEATDGTLAGLESLLQHFPSSRSLLLKTEFGSIWGNLLHGDESDYNGIALNYQMPDAAIPLLGTLSKQLEEADIQQLGRFIQERTTTYKRADEELCVFE